MSDVIVYDEEFWALAEAYDELAVLMNEQFDNYTDIVNKVVNDAIPSGRVHENLIMYHTKVATLRNQIKATLVAISRFCDDYVDQIDEADGELYD